MRIIVGVVLLNAGLLTAQPAEAPYASQFAKRFDAFQLLLADRDVTLGSFSELQSSDRPDNWLLVVLGKDPNLGTLGFNTAGFLQRGGRVFVASDQGMRVEAGPGASLRIVPGPISVVDQQVGHKGQFDSPLVTEFRRSSPLFAGVTAIALQQPGVLAGVDTMGWALAFLPRAINFRSPNRTVLAGGDIGKGRFLVFADSSPLTNEMIQEADNARFADNLVQWLLQGKDSAKTKVAIIVDRREPTDLVDERFVSGEWGEVPSTRDLINELLAGLQEEDAFNGILRETQNSLSSRGPWPVRQFALIILASMALSMLVWRILGSRREDPELADRPRTAETWVPALASEERAHLVPADRLLERRHADFEQADNHAAPLRKLAEDFLHRHQTPGNESTRLSHLPLQGTWWEKVQARRYLRMLERIARRASTAPVSAVKFRLWKDRVKQLDTMMVRSEHKGSVETS